MSTKKIPLRTCIGCSLIRPKRELARLLVTEVHEVVVDQSGKVPGRGAYICRIESEIEKVRGGLPRQEDTIVTASPACLEKARKSGAFQRAFKQKVNVDSLPA